MCDFFWTWVTVYWISLELLCELVMECGAALAELHANFRGCLDNRCLAVFFFTSHNALVSLRSVAIYCLNKFTALWSHEASLDQFYAVSIARLIDLCTKHLIYSGSGLHFMCGLSAFSTELTVAHNDAFSVHSNASIFSLLRVLVSLLLQARLAISFLFFQHWQLKCTGFYAKHTKAKHLPPNWTFYGYNFAILMTMKATP